MDLQEFIEETIAQIAGGIRNAGAKVKGSTCEVSPRNIIPLAHGDMKFYGYLGGENDNCDRIVEIVRFDVAVTTVEGKSKEGKLRVGFGSFGIGGGAKDESSGATESRIQFNVPVVLPNPSHEQR